MPGVKLIHHVNIQISDRERTRDWYEKVLGAQFLDRGSLNQRQLQLRIGTGEMHFTETPQPSALGHFAVEVDNWAEMLANLDKHGVAYTRSPGATNAGPPRTPEDDERQGRREDNGEHYTYIYDPDGNMIELVYHPLGLEDASGTKVDLADNSRGLRWKQKPEFAKSL